jgi:uncharacterized repeat protein (TIGR03803 family)
MRPRHLWIAGILAILCVPAFSSSDPSPDISQQKLIHTFTGSPDGDGPRSNLTPDADGNLYGTTVGGGTYGYGMVFEFKRTADGWKEEVLHSFTGGGDGAEPQAGVIFDATGNLYGTTLKGGAEDGGTVFELMPGDSGRWTEEVLYSFADATDGVYPSAGVTFDAAGDLYGTTAVGGTREGGIVFELTPGANGSWTEKVLHNFSEPGHYEAGPFGGLVIDAAGNLYGMTYGGGFNGDNCDPSMVGCGRVFELTPAANRTWTEKTIHVFNGKNGANPWAGVVLDKAGSVYGTTYWGGTGQCQNGYGKVIGCGVVFRLTPSSNGKWTADVLHNFDSNGFDGFQSFAGLALDAAENLYGTTTSGGTRGEGTVFKLTKQPDGKWSEKIVYNFGHYDDGEDPEAGVIVDAAGKVYGTTAFGGSDADGIVFEITP